MAYRSRGYRTRGRAGARSYSRRPVRRSGVRSRRRGSASAARTVRIVIEQPGMGLARDLVGMVKAPSARRAKF